jgi:hypothetical protein
MRRCVSRDLLRCRMLADTLRSCMLVDAQSTDQKAGGRYVSAQTAAQRPDEDRLTIRLVEPASRQYDYREIAMRKWTGLTMVTAVAATIFGCAQKPPGVATVIEDKVYSVTPASITVKAGVMTGEVTEMKVTERVEQGSGRIDSPAKLTGTLKLKNNSTDQTVRLLGGKIRYIDSQGQAIKLEEARTEPTIRFSSSSSERLDPGQDATQSVNVDFPTEALKSRKLKEIRLDLTYLPSSYRQETVNLGVSIGGQ